MLNEYKQVEQQLRESLDLWSDVMTASNEAGWGANMDFTAEDAFNALNIMNSICANIAIKSGVIKTEKDVKRISSTIKHMMEDCFGLVFPENKEKK